jgi:DNA-binding response OmpR family regulator
MPQILIVEDDEQIQSTLQIYLNMNGIDAKATDHIEKARALLAENQFDLILLDIGLPDGSGIDLCSSIRNEKNDIPIIFLSALTDEPTVVKGLNAGGDDYIRKPFGLEELKSRIFRILKKNQVTDIIIEQGPLTIDSEKRIATYNGAPISLTKREFDLLNLFVRRKGNILTRDLILNHFGQEEVFDRTVDSHISHLRKKLREVAKEHLQVVSVYGVGYRLVYE